MDRMGSKDSHSASSITSMDRAWGLSHPLPQKNSCHAALFTIDLI